MDWRWLVKAPLGAKNGRRIGLGDTLDVGIVAQVSDYWPDASALIEAFASTLLFRAICNDLPLANCKMRR